MQITVSDKNIQIDPNFRKEVERLSEANLDRCYQCFTCALGCPVAFTTEHTPNQIIRLIQMGRRNDVLESDLIWICASCETCAARCPNEIEIVKIMDTLRIMSLQEPAKKVKDIAFTHKIFIKLVATFGRMFELGYVMGMKLGNLSSIMPGKALFNDMILGYKMFSRGKLHILPHKTQGAEHIKKVMKNIEDRKKSVGAKS